MPGPESKWKQCQHGWRRGCYECKPDYIAKLAAEIELREHGHDAVTIANAFFTGSARQFFLEDDKWIMEEHGRISRTAA